MRSLSNLPGKAKKTLKLGIKVFSFLLIFLTNQTHAQNLVWQKSLLRNSVNSSIQLKSMDYDESFGSVILGFFVGTYDFDPGANIENVSSAPDGSTFIMKLDGNGNFSWVRSLEGNYHMDFADVQFDNAGNTIFYGYPQDTLFDVDPGLGYVAINNSNLSKTIILKLDSLGNYAWHQTLIAAEIEANGLALDSVNNIYFTGQFSQIGGMSVGSLSLPAVALPWWHGSDSYLAKIDSNGNPVWLKNFGESTNTTLDTDGSFIEHTRVGITSEGKICLTGMFTDTVDFDSHLSL